jgi:hypothetical protein
VLQHKGFRVYTKGIYTGPFHASTPTYIPKIYTWDPFSSKPPRVYTKGIYAGVFQHKGSRVYTQGIIRGVLKHEMVQRIYPGYTCGECCSIKGPAYIPLVYTRDRLCCNTPRVYTSGIIRGKIRRALKHEMVQRIYPGYIRGECCIIKVPAYIQRVYTQNHVTLQPPRIYPGYIRGTLSAPNHPVYIPRVYARDRLCCNTPRVYTKGIYAAWFGAEMVPRIYPWYIRGGVSA